MNTIFIWYSFFGCEFFIRWIEWTNSFDFKSHGISKFSNWESQSIFRWLWFINHSWSTIISRNIFMKSKSLVIWYVYLVFEKILFVCESKTFIDMKNFVSSRYLIFRPRQQVNGSISLQSLSESLSENRI